MLILDVEDPNHFASVDLRGKDQFVLRRGQKRNIQMQLLPLTTQPIRVEFPDTPTYGQNLEVPGSMIVCADGLFLTVNGTDGHGFQDAKYISMRDWTIRDDLPAAHSVFSAWRLTTSEDSKSDRRVLVFHGEW